MLSNIVLIDYRKPLAERAKQRKICWPVSAGSQLGLAMVAASTKAKLRLALLTKPARLSICGLTMLFRISRHI
jgi:hypothetical protein